jgi:hypothetical protein
MSYLSYVSSVVDLYRSVSPTGKNSIEGVNLEGFTSAVRLAMFPYALNAKISVEELAINFDFAYNVGGVNTKSFTRYFSGEGRQNFILVKRIARIMLDLFPPIPTEDGKEPHPITKIYFHIITGLEYIRLNFFPEQPLINKVPNPKTFDFDFDFKKHTKVTDLMAGDAIQKTINLFKYCCVNKIEPKIDLSPLQIEVKKTYNKTMLFQFSNGLDLIAELQGKTPLKAEWRVKNEFDSLNSLVQGRIEHYRVLVNESGKMIPQKKEDNLFGSNPIDDKKLSISPSLNTSGLKYEEKRPAQEEEYIPEKPLLQDEDLPQNDRIVNANEYFTNGLFKDEYQQDY